MKIRTIPFSRPALDLAPEIHYLLQNEPIARVRTYVGDEVWVVTRHEYVKALFNDDRLGRSHHDPANAARISNYFLLSGPVGEVETEKYLQDRMRRLITPSLTAHRIRAIEARVRELVDLLFDEMDKHGPPVDLQETLSHPLSVQVVCELLGVPFEDREQFESWAYDLDSVYDEQLAAIAFGKLMDYLRDLVERKRSKPAQDVLSDLIAAEDEWKLGTDDIAMYGLILLYAGYFTTATNLDNGVVFLLTNPDQKAALVRDPSLIMSAVEEVLRIAPLGGKFGQLRYAHADIAIGGVTIARGDGVLLMNGAANRDASVFPDPNRMDITRQPNAQLAFGHGPRRCLGSNLARMELTVVFGTLFQRFPGLAMVDPVDRLEIDETRMVERLNRLLVTW